MKMEQIECSETSAYKIQTPGNHPEENIQQDLILSRTFIYDQNALLLGCIVVVGSSQTVNAANL
jgi:hypothetical protein